MKSIEPFTADPTPLIDEKTGELALLLAEIEREEVPERLLELARQLQAALAARRNVNGQAQD